MAIFKYTVANQEGKKLSGTVEAPDEQTARAELNNLGFSILTLETIQARPQIDSSLTKFAFEAIDKNAKLVSGTVPAKNEQEALLKLTSEYNLTVSAIWPENATPEQISEARKIGAKKMQEEIKPEEESKIAFDPEVQKKNIELRTKIENTLNEVHFLLQAFDKELDAGQKSGINKKIDKLLRIKNSTNLDYILKTAIELLEFIQSQEEVLQQHGHEEKRLELKMETDKMLYELNKVNRPSLSEEIIRKIEHWQATHKNGKKSIITNGVNNFLSRIKDFFQTPPEIAVIKEQIKTYNRQLWEFAKLYFKEPTPEYKAKVKNSLQGVWQMRKKAIEKLKETKKQLRKNRYIKSPDENVIISFVEELNAFSGWLLAFYIIYYFSSLYLNTKDFGFTNIPGGFEVYNSQIFKYVLVIIFLLHSVTALKINFFKKNFVANIILIPVFIFGSIIALLNF